MGGKIAYSMSDLLRYFGLIDDDIVMMKDGCLMGGMALTGIDLAASTPDQRQQVANIANDSIRRLDENFMIHVVTVRVHTSAYPDGYFSEIVTRIMDDERKEYFRYPGNGFETKMFCFLTWQPPAAESGKAKKISSIFAKSKEKQKKGAKTKRDKNEVSSSEMELFERRIHDFHVAQNNFMATLSMIFGVRPLKGGDLLGALNLCVNGINTTHGEMPEVPVNLDALLARDMQPGSDYMIYDNRYITVMSLMDFPDHSYAAMLSELENMPYEYMWSIRFIPQDYRGAQNIITHMYKMWHQRTRSILEQMARIKSTRTNLDAVAKANDAEAAQQELDAGYVNFGNFTSTIIIRSDPNLDDDSAKDLMAQQVFNINNLLIRSSFGGIIEHRNAVEAFIGAMPGHGYENVRKPLLSSMNCAHIMPLGAAWTGPEYDECPFYMPNSPCLIQTGSGGQNPFRLPLHVGDVGHTLVLGPTGAGKSTLLATLAAQFDRYKDAQVFVFDKGRSMFPLIQAMENSIYYYLGRDDSEPLCPLADIDTPQERAWASSYVETLITLGKGEITPERRRIVQDALRTMATTTAHLPPDQRSKERRLLNLYIDLQDEHLKNALYMYTASGDFGKYLDGEKNTLKYSKYTAFELEDLMNLSPDLVIPTLLYMFHEIEKRLTGRPTLIILDEAWLMLNTPVFAARIKEWLKVLRKANAAVILATQALQDIVNSDIGSAILDSCPTKILLPNSQIESREMKQLYQGNLQLNDTEISILATARPKRDYFYVSPLGRRLFNLSLQAAQLAFVGSSGREDLKRVEELLSKYGKRWPQYWLDEKFPNLQLGNYWKMLENEKAQNGGHLISNPADPKGCIENSMVSVQVSDEELAQRAAESEAESAVQSV